MKKLLLLFSFFAVIIPCFSQITLIKTIEDGEIWFTENTNEYFTHEDGIVKIYDLNGIMVKEFAVPQNLSFEEFSSSFLSKNLFTNSGLYEYIAHTDDSPVRNYYIYNESGIMVFDFGRNSPFTIKGNMLITYCSINDVDIMKIYKLSGSATVDNSISQKTNNNLYPNPASNEINIIYSIDKMEAMEILDRYGKVIETILLDPSNEIIRIDLSEYAAGVYFYKYSGNSGKFIVTK